MIRTVICDDHPLITQGLKSYIDLNRQIQIVASAASAKELRDVLSVTDADVLLLDIQLPDGTGIDLCAEIKHAYQELKIL